MGSLMTVCILPKRWLGISAALMITPINGPAFGQLATSPTTRLPPIIVDVVPAPESKKKKAAAKPKRRPALAAAEQSSTPPRANAVSPEGSSGRVVVAPTGLSTSVEKTASAVTVISSKEIAARQYRTLPDVLQSVPGLNVVQTGGAGGQTSVFIRGANSNHVKVLIDGIDVSDPSSANRSFDYSQLLVEDIERIEVLRGPQSGLYGADALGGVIVIYTKKGKGPPRATAMVEGGAQGTFNQAASVRGSYKKFNFAGSVTHLQSRDIEVTPKNLLAPGLPRFSNSYENWTYSTKLGFQATTAVSFNVVARHTNSTLLFTEASFPAPTFLFTLNNKQSQQDVMQTFLRGEMVWRSLGGRLVSFFGTNYAKTESETFSPASFSGLDGQRVKYDWRSIYRLAPGYTLVVGGDHQEEDMEIRQDGASGSSFLEVGEWNRGGYGQLIAEPFEALVLTANIRIDDNENFGQHTTWRMASAYTLKGRGTKLKASVGTAFKAPTLSQRFQDFPALFFFANPNLQPEESIGYDIGFEQLVFPGWLRFGASYFHNDITNLIQFKSSGFTSTVVNIGEAETKGVEAFFAADLSADIRVRGDYTYTVAKDAIARTELLRRPRHKATLTAGWQVTAPLLISGQLLFVGRARDIDRATSASVTLPAFTTVNLAADYKLNDKLSLFGRINNLLDKRYENPDGFLAPGFGAYVGIRVTN